MTALAKQDRAQTLAKYLDETLRDQIAVALPKHLPPDRMVRVALTALRTVPKLAQCSQVSFAGAIMTLAQLGLEPNTPLGHAYLIPRNDKKRGLEVTVIIGYQGYLELARRSGLVKSIYAHDVCEGDAFEYELGLHPRLYHVPCGEGKTLTHAYAVAKIEGGDPVFSVLTLAEIEARRKRGASGQGYSTPWDSDYAAMAMKSAVRALWPWLPKSAEMARAADVDADRPEDIAAAVERAESHASFVGGLNAAIDAATGEVAGSGADEGGCAADPNDSPEV